MNRQELEAVIRRVVEQYQDNLTGSGDLSFPVEASANHVHLTREAVETLFGAGTELTCDRQLSQPGEFLSGQRLRLATAKGELGRVAVLGPERSAVQVEMSLTDLRRLGIKAPVNLSGNLSGARRYLPDRTGGCAVGEGLRDRGQSPYPHETGGRRAVWRDGSAGGEGPGGRRADGRV